MEKHRICKICSKSFPSGKAMGGHMRSHLAKLPVPPKPPQQQQPPPPPPPQKQQQQQPTNWAELSPPFSSANGGMHSSSSVLNRSPSVDSASDSETESHPRNHTRRRSKRRRKVVAKAAETPLEAEQVSSVTDTFSTEDVAWCLIKLSRDKWDKWGKVKVKNEVDESVEMDGHDEEDEEDEDESGFRAQTRTRKYRCDTCNKVFKSYQALGGHRASHKKLKIAQVFVEEEDEDFEEIDVQNQKGNFVADQQRIFECSFCFKQFESGQALGGHKKIHYYTNLANNGRINGSSSSSAHLGDNLVIDLNLPAPEVEDEEIEFSTISD